MKTHALTKIEGMGQTEVQWGKREAQVTFDDAHVGTGSPRRKVTTKV